MPKFDGSAYYPSLRNGQPTTYRPQCDECALPDVLVPSKEFVTYRKGPCPRECVSELSWAAWLAEVMVGLENPNEEVAANCVRAAAIRFCKETNVLQRKVCAKVSCDEVLVFPVWEQEQAIRTVGDVLAATSVIKGSSSIKVEPSRLVWHLARRECFAKGFKNWNFEFNYAAAPTEMSLAHDAVLYERWREPIATRARHNYIRMYHYTSEAVKLLQPRLMEEEWRVAVLKAQSEVTPFRSGTPYHPRRMSGL